MAITLREFVDERTEEVDQTDFVDLVVPGVQHARGVRALVRENAASIGGDFPYVVDRYNQSLLSVARRMRAIRPIARVVVKGSTYVGVPCSLSQPIGMLTLVPGGMYDVPETHDGVNFAVWLGSDHRNQGVATRISSEFDQLVNPNRTLWTVARPDNAPSVHWLAHIGMSAVGTPEMYEVGDGVSAKRQLYVAQAGDVAQTAGCYAELHYPVEVHPM
ncbi:MAG: GNAT family protein [Candidatus Saccharimonadales bacterium]